jgi:putative tryptophan/tyrosine transport system substrate-binding protein
MTQKIVICVLLTALLLIASVINAQQAKKIPRIGYLSGSGTPNNPGSQVEAFRQGLRDLGYIEGKNILVEYRYAEGREDRFRDLAAELVGLNVDVLVTASTIAVRAAKQLSATMPIVMAGVGDAVATGLVASLSRPGANVTGITALGSELSTKQLEVLKDIFPRVSRVAVLFNAVNPSNVNSWKQIEAVAPSMRVRPQPLEVRGHEDFAPAFNAAVRERADALLVIRDPLNQNQRTRIVTLAAQTKLPAIYPLPMYVDVGGLMSYGIDQSDSFRRAAIYVDKILKGAKPADLPVEQPTKFEFIINLKTAKQIGLTIPPNVLARADKVIR